MTLPYPISVGLGADIVGDAGGQSHVPGIKEAGAGLQAARGPPAD